MSNWVREFLLANPEAAALPVVKRARRSLHLRRPDGKIEAHFTGAPCHYEASPGNWQPLDTEPQYDAARAVWHCPGLDVTVGADATVRLGDYSQLTRRVGLFRPSTHELLGTRDVPLGTRVGDALIADGDWWRVERRITETGYREWLTLKERPPVAQTLPGDFLVLETVVTGVSLPNGWLDDKYNISTHWSPAPVAWDANDQPLLCRRYWRDGVLYTGIPVEELAHATYPVTIDPDFTGLAADGDVYGESTNYATARATAYLPYSYGVTICVGQEKAGTTYRVYRSFLKFDTSAIGAGSTVTQVNLQLVCTNDWSTYADFNVQIVKQDWSAQDPIASGNKEAIYDNCLAGTADDNIWRSTTGMSTNTQYASGNLNTVWVSKIGNTYYSLRSSRDLAATTPTGAEFIAIAAREHATAAYRPILTVLYEELPTEDNLTADNLTASAPVLGTPAIGQVHVLTVDSLAIGAPVLGEPAISQVHILAAEDLTIGAPVLGEPAIGQEHALLTIRMGSLVGVTRCAPPGDGRTGRADRRAGGGVR